MKSKYFLRYKFIIEKLQRSKLANYSEIKEYLADKFEILGCEFSYSLRTFQRDKTDISELFDIIIENDRSENAYFINENEISEPARKLLDAFAITNALQLHDDYTNIISFEEQNIGEQGVFYELIDAVKSKNKIKLYYQKYYAENLNEYILEPLALKEFRQRWYLVASAEGGKNIRTFGLDRILKVEALKAKFKNNKFNINNFFKDYYGIMTDINSEFAEVVLQFDSFQGKYIKSLPLHHSQEIIEDNEDGLIIKLKLHITFDFKQKLLSYGSLIKIISPKSLTDEIIEDMKEALKHY